MLNKGRAKDNGPSLSQPHTLANAHVVLTGSTGNLGSYLLDFLLQTPNISRITCLNRSANALERQLSSHRARGLTTSLDASKVEFIQCDLSQRDLGIPPQTHAKLATSVTHIIHNAWPVSFNLSFSSFEPHIRGVRNLIDFVASTNHQAFLFFVSSVSVVGRWGTLSGAVQKVPEVVLDDWRTAKMGYGQSKLVSERLIAEASRTMGIKAAVCRVGQLSGPVQRGEIGQWNKNEWLPSLIQSSQYLGVIPSDLGPMDDIDWTPIDMCAQIIVELLHSTLPKEQAGKPHVYHIANPTTVPYSSILPVIKECLGSERKLKDVPFITWVTQLEKSAKLLNAQSNLKKSPKDDWEHNPAAKLIQFFDELRDKADRFPNARAARLDTTTTQRLSPTLSGVQPVDGENIGLWMKQWGYV